MWDEGSRLYGVRELALTWLLPAGAICVILNWPWAALVIVPAFIIFIGFREHAKARKLEADREAGRKREAETERNREIGKRVYEMRQAGMEYEDIIKRLKV